VKQKGETEKAARQRVRVRLTNRGPVSVRTRPSIGPHSTSKLLVSIHIHAIFTNVSWSVVDLNPECSPGFLNHFIVLLNKYLKEVL
jgi:hypothetical protein